MTRPSSVLVLGRRDPGGRTSPVLKPGRRKRFAISTVLGVLLSVSSLAPVAAHHVGVFIPKDDDITKNFKDIKFASQAGRFDVALKLFDDGIVHATIEKHEKSSWHRARISASLYVLRELDRNPG